MKSFTFDRKRISIHPSWADFFTPETKFLLKAAEAQLPKDYLPVAHHAFRFMQTDLEKAKVIFITPPPFDQGDDATGRPLEKSDKHDWRSPLRPPLLVKTLKKLYAAEHPPKKLKEIRQAILTGSFEIVPPSKLAAQWEKQGVLLLPSSLTFTREKIHYTLWKPFLYSMVKFICNENKMVPWIAFGRKERDIAEMAGIPLINGKTESPFEVLTEKINWKVA